MTRSLKNTALLVKQHLLIICDTIKLKSVEIIEVSHVNLSAFTDLARNIFKPSEPHSNTFPKIGGISL